MANLPVKAAKQKGLGKPWRKGESGNPSGRPKEFGLRHLLVDELEKTDESGVTVAKRLAGMAVALALQGDFRFYKEIADRVDGPIKQIIEQDGGLPVIEKWVVEIETVKEGA
jgi:hypothetical protein